MITRAEINAAMRADGIEEPDTLSEYERLEWLLKRCLRPMKDKANAGPIHS